MAPSVPRTRAAAGLRMKQIALDNQSHMIRRLRAKLAIERRESAAIKKEHESTQVALEASHMTIVGLTEIGLCMSKKIERMKAKKQQTRDSHQECHHKWKARIQAVEDTIQEQHLIIEALVEEKASLLQTIQCLQEDNGALAPFDDEWEEKPEEDPEEEELEDIPIGEGEIVDE
ncbi:LRR and NB-ARC domains-containing disease resistance protein [Dorcoceras hygrometricum]|uniref:LRR and NB-ARC domains-containing disease resistance protein n=1 Tax=Dorcoceras hygrometricum TaxID=472368 RepID=A0A2Z7ACG3_9LAMI|nr:LRR and NB-ARC domains-containing disease resistance protein [Dorcoceras hygrometricum]